MAKKNLLLNPKTETFEHLDPASRRLMTKTIEFFENKGLKKLKHDDHERVWYADFLEVIKNEKIFATLMTPAGYGAKDSRWDTYRNCDFSEVTAFYGLCYWYTWQVTMLGLGPIWMSKNEKVKQKTAQLLQEGGIFAFGLSERAHGADLISSEVTLTPKGDGKYTASGRKYYIGNGNKAALVSTFGKIAGSNEYVFFVVSSSHQNYKLIQNVVNSQNYVSEYELDNYPITDDDILAVGREAWDMSLATVALCKYNLGWASVGICTHAFYEAINHASNRVLFKHKVTEFSHIQQFFVDAYARLIAMKLFARRASDYMRAASENDKRYLLYNPMVKMKVTMQGEEVINLLWDVIAARGFEKDLYFEMAARDIRGLPKLEGTAQVNMVLILKFIENFLFNPSNLPELPKNDSLGNDAFMFTQGSTSKAQNKILFHDYNKAYDQFKQLENIATFRSQIDAYKDLVKNCPPGKEQAHDLDFMLIYGELFTLVAYGQLILEAAKIENLDVDLVDQIFDFMVRDFSKYAVQLYSKTSSTAEQMAACMKMVKKPKANAERYERVTKEYVYALNGQYAMNP
ncbi:MAG: acyl-CoA dehydrogenase family protein [Turneriella sp.]